jgi:sugar O-acyltransferase (sialic acid O-acetyltransferase NeuD family)
MRPLILVGASGLAREVVGVLDGSDTYKPIGFLDDDAALLGREVADLPVFGGVDTARDHDAADFLVCTGSGRSRRVLVERLQRMGVGRERYATVIATSAVVPASCQVGRGSIVLAGVVLTADVAVGCHTVLMPHVVCTHDNQLGDFVTLCAGVGLGGSVTVGDEAYLGMNCTVRQNGRVAAGAVLGMGAVLLADLPAGQVWAGNPARLIDHGARS